MLMPVNIGITLIIKLAFIYVLQTEGLYPPKIHMVETDAQCDGILMRLWEATKSGEWSPLNGIPGLTEGTPECSLTPAPNADTANKWPLRTRKRALSRHRADRHTDPGLPSLQKCEKCISVVYKPPSLWRFGAAA